MKLLFDANLSPRLTELLRDVFPESAHVFGIGCLTADDLSIWNHARDHDFTIVSKERLSSHELRAGRATKGYLVAHRQLLDVRDRADTSTPTAGYPTL